MTLPIKRTLSMRPEVDRMLTEHVQRTPGASMSSTVNAALVQSLESAAIEAYRQWDADADPEERDALDAFAARSLPRALT
jgi:Arc/MetJ-type ribon-helix-helix transcriptional regulator